MAPLPPVLRWTSSTAFLQFSAVRSPGTTASSRRLSGSTAVWSQSSPLSASPGSSGSQPFSFLATKLHFSSNWTSRVAGGKGHQLVVQALGLVAGQGEVAADGVPRDPGQPAGGADAAALAGVVEDGDGLVSRQPGAFQGGALALGRRPLAGATVNHADVPVAPAEAAEIQVAVAALAVVRAGGIVAKEGLDGEAGWLCHGASPWRVYSPGKHPRSRHSMEPVCPSRPPPERAISRVLRRVVSLCPRVGRSTNSPALGRGRRDNGRGF